ncbi:MAG: hypothetical protein U0939_08365 [Pirellulales bacterium]
MIDAASLSPLYRSLVAVLIVAAAATLAGRLSQVQSSSGLTPFMSANDRSRWSTVRALVDHGTYELDEVIFTEPPPEDDGRLQLPKLKRDHDWYSIDLVRHRGADGREHYYSSKPPLLATLVAAEYWVLKQATGASLANQPFYVGRVLIFLTNILPMAAAWWLLARVLDGWHPSIAAAASSSLWSRLFILVAAAWGTLLSPMALTLNNHTPAAVGALVTAAALLRIWRAEPAANAWYALAGGAAAFTAANELPALTLTSFAALAAALRCPRRALVGFAPAAACVAAAAVGTTYLAHGTWIPPYAHRHDGAVVARVADRQGCVPDGESVRPPSAVLEACREAGIELSDRVTQRPAGEGRWTLFDPATHQRWALTTTESGGEVRDWKHWYDFEGTYWRPDRLRGVDRGEPSRWTYAFHALLGHHGLISLTPIWLLSLAGGVLYWRRPDVVARAFAAGVAGMTLVCLAFYISRPLIDRNYGGVSCGMRWMFWFTPLWLILMTPAVDRWAASRWGRAAMLMLLAASIFAASWNGTRPWAHPWIYDYWVQLRWINP